MKLYNLLEKIDESQDVIITDGAGLELSRYDGKNSIDPQLLNNSVLCIYAFNDDNGAAVLCIQIYDN